MSVDLRSVSDIRTAKGDVTGEPELRTPGGRSPIDPRWIEVIYNIQSGLVYSVVVGGEKLDPSYDGYRKFLTRRIEDLDTAPEWVRLFVTKNSPTFEFAKAAS